MVFLKDFILNAKINNKPIFIGVEQGTGKYAMHVYVMFEPKMKVEAHKWLHNTYNKYVLNRTTSVPPIK